MQGVRVAANSDIVHGIAIFKIRARNNI